jgi:hypothetical protein
MPNKDWNVGDYPAAAEFDALFQQQVIALFDDNTMRDAAVASDGMGDADDLVDGQRSTTRDDGRSWVWMVTDDPDPGDGYWVEVDRWKDWGTYTPVITVPSGGTAPTMGTGNVAFGRWTRHGSHATVALYVAFGSSGSPAAGTGIYEISLPSACPAHTDWYTSQQIIVGNGIAIDDSIGTRRAVACKVIAADRIRLESDGLTGPVTESNLLTWAASDVVCSALIEYEMEMF